MTFELTEPILLIGIGGVGSRLVDKAKKSLHCDCLLISHDKKDLTSENSIKISTKSVVNPSTHLIRGSTLETSNEIKEKLLKAKYDVLGKVDKSMHETIETLEPDLRYGFVDEILDKSHYKDAKKVGKF